MIRTHNAGSLRAADAGSTVTLAGWVARRRDHGGVIFVDLRDASGVVQVVFREEDAHALRNEFCVKVTGEVTRRPEGNENPDLPTGEVEVTASALEVLSEAAPLPLPVDDQIEAGDDIRLKYRYLDLRRGGPAKAMRLRSRANQIARGVLHERDFLEIETPTLTRSTPEGARDFLVPVRLQPGSWYALPQSPQLFKQLLMVGGMERYYQIARCYRDEDFRADRQPEFTQLDIEMSFVTEDDVIDLGEAIVSALWKDLAGYEIARPIPRITWHDAMSRYGSDKPDLRYGVELTELTDYLRGTEFRVFAGAIDAGGYVGAVVMPGGAAQTRKELDGWQDWAKARGARGLAYVVLDAETGEPRGPVAKNLSEAHLSGLADAVGAKPGDAIFFAASTNTREAQELLGAARIEIAKRSNLIDESAWAFCWVVDAPMFEPTSDRRTAERAAGPPCTTRSPRRTPSGWTGSRTRRTGRWRTRTTSSATATRSAAARSVSTAATCSSGCSTCSASPPTRRRTSSASCWRRSSTAPRRTAASRSAGTGSACCWPAPTRSAR